MKPSRSRSIPLLNIDVDNDVVVDDGGICDVIIVVDDDPPILKFLL